VRAVLRAPGYRSALLVGATLALVMPGDALLFLTFQRDAGLTAAQFPLLFSAASVSFLIAAAPLGRLADRIGRLPVFLGGEALVGVVLAVLASGARGTAALVLFFVALGTAYAATDGVLAAMACATLPAASRTTGLALLVSVVAFGRFLASSAFGALWGSVGGVAAARMFLVGVVIALAVGLAVRRSSRAAEALR
jgi:MFS family permease